MLNVHHIIYKKCETGSTVQFFDSIASDNARIINSTKSDDVM